MISISLRLGLVGCAFAAVHGREVCSQDPPRPLEVLIVGTYHFANPGRDVVNPKVSDVLLPTNQAEIAEVVDALARFRPTKIAVETPLEAGAWLDSLYQAYRHRTHVLSRNEVEQLGFRLAARLGHKRVFALDHAGTFPLEPVLDFAKSHDPGTLHRIQGVFARIGAELDSLQQHATVRQILLFENNPERIAWGHGLYLDLARVGAADSLVGADLLAAWYERNVRIFVNLLRIAHPGDRILSIVRGRSLGGPARAGAKRPGFSVARSPAAVVSRVSCVRVPSRCYLTRKCSRQAGVGRGSVWRGAPRGQASDCVARA
jgi:hypothetical protein